VRVESNQGGCHRDDGAAGTIHNVSSFDVNKSNDDDRARHRACQVVLAQRGLLRLTGYRDIPITVQAMKAGAVDFLSRPVRDQTPVIPRET
jgi:DNA-binding NtrC family response regulator